VVPAGSTEFRWKEVLGATQYILNVHEDGQSYDCTLMTFCGNLPGTSKFVTTKPGKKYDWWVLGIDDKGNPGKSRGSSFTAQSTVTPPPVTPPPVTPPPVTPPSGPAFKNIRQGEYTDAKGRKYDAIFYDTDCDARRIFPGKGTEAIICKK